MNLNWLNKLGEWNPQLFRELKGRLTSRNLGITVTTSLLIQALVVAYFLLALPGEGSRFNPYCTINWESYHYSQPECGHDAAGNIMINWDRWWFDLFHLLSWALPFVVMIAGVYLLINDLGREERRGTLNFIRLSPQSSQTILLGKLLGVPVIPLVGVAVAIPLHLIAAVEAGVSTEVVFSIYVFAASIAITYYVGALLVAFLAGFQGWIGAIAIWFTFSIFFPFIVRLRQGREFNFLPREYWGVKIGQHLSLSLAFWVVTLGVATFWFWKAVNRRFRNPSATLISKIQSYWISLSFELWLLGYAVHDRSDWEKPMTDLGILLFVNLFWFVLLTAALMPQRQALLDWIRYRQERNGRNNSVRLLKDLMWAEKSPGVLAVALNLGITTLVFLPWIATWTGQQLQALVAIVFVALFVLVCAILTQSIVFLKSSRRNLWATILVGALVFLPPVLLGSLGFYPNQVPFAWLFSVFAFAAVEHTTPLQVGFALMTYLGIFSLLTLRFTRQLRKADESAMKALLATRS
jgi:hypothetical protein